ncbi:hypothetical protein EDC96DRAFT_504605 [Choanephora cucurbitarum]|uniref:Uncharacterized protein n=1 Tax=Choanephora cucurbitarum TaxID=101091 RepID=A0A1C7NPB3_9FUNG|nr:hypothetical protein EDC96DRAFT_504605 [Choanephora cucurbitarum]OBZ89094.1 hypothetical protein A0J61_02852 [Choanephora cucurbitarum]
MTTQMNFNESSREELPQFTSQEYASEQSYFNDYDQEMINAVNEADCYDYPKEEEDVYIIDEGLLKLILDVQSYLAEAPQDSPLFALQYKMYTYLRQRASELGMDVSSLL